MIEVIRMKLFVRMVAVVLLLACLMGQFAVAEATSVNPLIDPQDTPTVKTPQRYTNILMLGVDFGFKNYRGSGSGLKPTLADCHTDAVMVVSINMTTEEVSLISLPRDTLTYVPQVHGIYKLNGAFNCADTVEEGLERICSAASWLLGGITIDHYCAVDMEAMIALGDFIGGVDLDVEMSYTGHSGKYYSKGMQHLDGTGIMDYVRSRKNATVNANDIGRTGRQRQTMAAIFQKVKSNASLIKSGWDFANSGEINFFTDMSLAKVLNLLNKVKGADTMGSYVLTGPYKTALKGWNFTFTDQANRIEVIKSVYGIEVPELPYVSYDYTEWLMDEGFTTARYIAVARQVLNQAAAASLTGDQQTAVEALQAALDEAIAAFDTAADSKTAADTSAMVAKRKELRTAGNAVSQLLDGEDAGWYTGKYWYADPLINEYQFSWQ